MAREPYSPVPTVEPTGPSGTNLQIQATPAEFGGLAAQGEQRFGADFQQAGGRLMQSALFAQGMRNEADARAASNGFMQDAGNAWAQFGTLQGKEASDAYPQFSKQLEQLQQQRASQLGSPQARNDFLNASSYMLNRLTLMGSTHAAQQEREYWKQSHAANIETAGQWGVLMQNDPHSVDAAANSIADSVHQVVKMNGGSDDTAAAQTQQALGRYYREVIRSQAAQNPAVAMSTFDRVRGRMDAASIAAVDAELRVAHNQQQVDSFVQRHSTLTGPDVQPAQQGLTPTRIRDALISTEGSGPAAVSSAGATGRSQIIRSTFDQYKLPGESYANEDDRNAAAARYVDDMWKKYPGDVARIAVGYSSGTGNIAPAGSQTPWIENKSDGITTTAQYVNRAVTNLHTPPDVYAQQYARIRAAETDAMRQFPGNPTLQREAVNQVRQQIALDDAALRQVDAAGDKQRKDQETAAEDDYIPKIITDPTSVDIKAIASDPRLAANPEKRHTLVNMLNTSLQNNPKLSVVSHQTATNLVNDMRRPADDPQRISDLSPAYDAYQRGDLTNADFNFVQQQFTDMKTPDGERLNQTMDNFLKAVKPSVDKSNPLMGQLDMSGGTEYFRLQQELARKVAQYRKDGKNPYDLFDPSKPDYVGKPEALAPYQKSIPESIEAITGRLQQSSAPVTTAAPVAAAAPEPTAVTDEGFGAAAMPAVSEPEGRPLTSRQAVRQLPMAQTEGAPKAPRPSLDQIFGTPPSSAAPH